MLLVKLSAADIRMVRASKSPAEIEGVREMLLQRITQAETLKQLKQDPRLRKENFVWNDAWDVMEGVLGKGNLTKPPFPNHTWYRRVAQAVSRNGMDADAATELAEYAKAKLRMPVSFDFLICQQARIIAGEFDQNDQTPAHRVIGPVYPAEIPRLPED